MPHHFLVPAQTLLTEVNRLIVAENKKQPPNNANREIIKSLIAARTELVAAEKKYKTIFTTKQHAELSPLVDRLEIKTQEFLRLTNGAETTITHFTKDVKEDDETPVLEQVVKARVLGKDADINSDCESSDNSQSDEGLDLQQNILALFQDTQLFSAQLTEIQKKGMALEKLWESFFQIMNTCDIEKLDEAQKELKRIYKIAIKAIHETQTNHAMPKDDLGMILIYQNTCKGLMQLHDNFQTSFLKANETIERLAQQISYPTPETEATPSSPTGSTQSFSTYTSSFFSSPSSPRSGEVSANDEESESELEEVDEPPRKCARR